MLEREGWTSFARNRFNPRADDGWPTHRPFLRGNDVVKKKSVFIYTALLTLSCSGMALTQTTHAAGFNPMNMMNPGKWFGGRNRDRYDDDYYYDRYDRYGPGYGYGRGWGPGWGGYGPGYGYGAYGPGYGYGYGPGYGYGAPGYGATRSAPAPLPQ